MLVDNLFFYYENYIKFLWGYQETQKLLRVEDRENKDNMTVQKYVYEVNISNQQLYKIENFEMDPQGSELVVIEIIINYEGPKKFEMMIFQENRFGVVKLLTPISQALEYEYDKENNQINSITFLNHPEVNLKYLSINALQDVFFRYYYFENGDEFFVAKDLADINLVMSKLDDELKQSILNAPPYLDQVTRMSYRRVNPDKPIYVEWQPRKKYTLKQLDKIVKEVKGQYKTGFQ